MITWGVASAVATVVPFVIGPLVIVVLVGLISSIALNSLDAKYGLTDKVIHYIELAQQEATEKVKEVEEGLLDLGAMFIDGMLETGKEIIIDELRIYIRKTLKEIKPTLL